MAVQAPDIIETREEAERLELAPLIIRSSLQRYLAEHLAGGDGEIELERIGEGHSNITYLVARGEQRFVLRRPPRPPLPPSAHDVLREWRLLDAIKDTRARVPRTLLACDDESVIGAPFYRDGVRATGRSSRTRSPARSTRPSRAPANGR